MGRHRGHRLVRAEVTHLLGNALVGGSEEAYVVDPLPEHERAVETNAHRQPAVAVRRNPSLLQDGRRGEAALQEFDPAVPAPDLDFEAVLCVWMGGGERAMPRSWKQGLDDVVDHLVKVVLAQGAAVDAPEVELVRLTNVESVDHVASIDKAGAASKTLAQSEGPRERSRPGITALVCVRRTLVGLT